MLTRETITVGHQRFRVAPWHGREGVALLSVPADQSRPSTADVRCALEVVASRGYGQVITSALTEYDTSPFIELGFVEDDRLHVLEHSLEAGWADLRAFAVARGRTPRVRVRRGRRSDRAAALDIDRRAFPAFWQLDAQGLADAKEATPSARFRMATINGADVGYSVTGRGGDTGFLQRLATDPSHQRRGVATELVLDALRWCDARRCSRVLVNTQVTNRAALALYGALGFDRTPNDLVVLSWTPR